MNGRRESYDSSRVIYREDTTRFYCWALLPSRPVGPWDRTEQSVLAGSDAKEEGTDPVGPVGPDVSFDQIQPVADGPVGQYITRSPVGPDGMLCTCDSDQPMAEGPVGQYIARSPMGPEGMFSTCDSIARSPMSEFSPSVPEPTDYGPVGQSVTTGPVGPCGTIPQCAADDPIADRLVRSIETPDPVDETDGPIQIDVM